MPIMLSKRQVESMEALAQVQSARMVNTPASMRYLSMALILTVFLGILGLAFVPWQQSVSGVGEVSTLNPMHRPQTVQAPIDARIEQWLVQEGQWVKKGQALLQLKEIKNTYLDETQLDKLQAMRDAQALQVKSATLQLEALESQYAVIASSQGAVMGSATAKVQENKAKVSARVQSIQAAQKEFETATLFQKRTQKLYDEGLKSKRDLELANNQWVNAQSKYQASQADLEGAKQATLGADFDRGKFRLELGAKLTEVNAKIAKAAQEHAKATAELLKLDNDLENLRQRYAQRRISSPVTGRLVRTSVYGGGQTVKEGDELAVVVPQAGDRMVTLFFSDVDAPLLSVGRLVRLQFAGFPAVQFSGWPKAALGTFAGRIQVIDAVDDGQNRFRVLVVPDFKAIQAKKEEPWPENEHLRYGTQALGWVMLDEVPLGYELWRRFNGFQLNLQKKPPPVNSAIDNVKATNSAGTYPTKMLNDEKTVKFGDLKSNAGKQK